MKKIRNILKNIIIFPLVCLIKFYQSFISPLIGKNCIFYPTCSQYFIQALQKYGILKGSYLGVKRILRCHPWNKGGYDPLK